MATWTEGGIAPPSIPSNGLVSKLEVNFKPLVIGPIRGINAISIPTAKSLSITLGNFVKSMGSVRNASIRVLPGAIRKLYYWHM